MTAIEWTDATWNPTVGCSRVSPGCDGCYAIGVAARQMQPAHQGLTVRTPSGMDWTGEVRMLLDRLDTPMRWRKPRRVFVDSMSDLFHRDVPADFIRRVWVTMALTPQHTYQVLTKRPDRMMNLLASHLWDDEVGMAAGADEARIEWCHSEYPTMGETGWLPNVWLGTSIESDRFMSRARRLQNTPAAVRFMSLEPLLGPLPSLDLHGIGWVIVGGESGRGARPMDLGWARDIRDQCAVAGVPLFVKQLGSRHGKDHKSIESFPADLQIREWPT